jgi:hypothetical protein
MVASRERGLSGGTRPNLSANTAQSPMLIGKMQIKSLYEKPRHMCRIFSGKYSRVHVECLVSNIVSRSIVKLRLRAFQVAGPNEPKVTIFLPITVLVRPDYLQDSRCMIVAEAEERFLANLPLLGMRNTHVD